MKNKKKLGIIKHTCDTCPKFQFCPEQNDLLADLNTIMHESKQACEKCCPFSLCTYRTEMSTSVREVVPCMWVKPSQRLEIQMD